MTTDYRLPGISFIKLRFVLTAQAKTRLSAFKGSLLRKGFAEALRRNVCVMDWKTKCQSCFLRTECVFTRIFETIIQKDPPPFLSKQQYALKPYVLDFADDGTLYETGDSLTFDFVIMGSSAANIGMYIIAVQQMGKFGIGEKRSPFGDLKVFRDDGDGGWLEVYSQDSGVLKDAPNPVLIDTQPQPASKVKLHFLTPTSIKIDSSLSIDFNFRKLVFNMLRRTLEAAFFYMPDASVDWEFKPYLKRASDIRITDKQLAWVDHHHFSGGKSNDLLLGGFVGSLTLEGDLAPFVPLMRIAEAIHVGKRTNFGFGKVRLEMLT